MKLNRALVAASFILACACIAHAQPAAVQQLQNTQQQMQMPQPVLRVGTNAPEIYAGENEDIGPQRILRVNQRPRSEYFDVVLDSQIFYSDNANFASSSANLDSWVFVNTVQAAFAPTPFNAGPGKLGPAIGFSSQWYNYGDRIMSALDFNAQTAFVNLRYYLGKWQFGPGVNYTRLLSQGSYNETYQEWLPNYSIQRAFPICDSAAIVVGDTVDYHFTRVPFVPGSRRDINDHLDDTVFLSLNWQATRHLVVQPFYRFQYSYYPHNTLVTSDRNDWLNSVGVTLLYSFNRYASMRAFFSYNTKSSDDNFTAHYDELNGGLGLTLDVKF